MENVLEEFAQQIELLCKRQGMYTGDNEFSSFSLYFCGLLHGMSISGYFSFKQWREWVFEKYGLPKDGSWESALLVEFKTHDKIIEEFPSVVKKFSQAYKTNA